MKEEIYSKNILSDVKQGGYIKCQKDYKVYYNNGNFAYFKKGKDYFINHIGNNSITIQFDYTSGVCETMNFKTFRSIFDLRHIRKEKIKKLNKNVHVNNLSKIKDSLQELHKDKIDIFYLENK